MTAGWPHGDPRDVIRGVLADPRFARAAQHPGEKSWWERVLDALGRAWHWLVDPLKAITGNDRLATIVGTIVLAVVVIALVAVAIVYARRISWRRARRPSNAAMLSSAEPTSRALLGRALEAAAAGRHHEAAALLWASALRALDERGRVRFDAARTPGEWRRAVRDPSFDALARDAVVALFGDRDADAALVGRMRDAYDRVVRT